MDLVSNHANQKIEERHTNTMNKMHFWAGVLVIAAVSSMADAAYQAMPRRTCNDKDFYARHQHSCAALEREYFRAQGSVSDVPYVTVTRDFQAADTGGHVKDPFISLQTREDMERSRGRMPQTYGWLPSAMNFFDKQPPVYASALPAPAPRKRVVVVRTTRTIIDQ